MAPLKVVTLVLMVFSVKKTKTILRANWTNHRMRASLFFLASHQVT